MARHGMAAGARAMEKLLRWWGAPELARELCVSIEQKGWRGTAPDGEDRRGPAGGFRR